MATYAHQDSLPKLPVPELEDTLRHFVGAVKHLQTPEEWAETQQIVARFKSEEGPALQQALQQRAESQQSYVAEWWNDSYLTPQDSVVLNLNPFFVLADDPTPSRNDQASRATSLVHAALGFARAVRQETLPPDVVRGSPLCMSQFKQLFSTARIPVEGRDQVATATGAGHVVVVCRGQYYLFDALDEQDNVIVTERDIHDNLSRIISHAASAEPAEAPFVGILTTENRSLWARTRAQLLEASPVNVATIEAIDSALFLVCLDHVSPTTPREVADNMLHGSYCLSESGAQTGTVLNRWYDKLQLIVCENGAAGCNFEHSSVDGHTVLRFASDVFTETILHFAQSIHGHIPSLFSYGSTPPADQPIDTRPRRLRWVTPRAVSAAIGFAEMRISDLVVQNETETLEFCGFGKQAVTASFMSPDSFVQMALLTTYFSLYGEVPSTYEPVMTKRFLAGRTEAVRGVCSVSIEHVRLWCDPDASPQAKLASLRGACKKHSQLVRRSAQGLGVDRHLFGLSCMWRELHPDQPLPALFSDSGWRKLNHTQLSTSNCGNPSLRFFGFGPVVPDGFGVGYIISSGGFNFCVTSKHRQTRRFVETLRGYLEEVGALLDAHGTAPSSPSRARGSSTDGSGYGFFDAGEQGPAPPRRLTNVGETLR